MSSIYDLLSIFVLCDELHCYLLCARTFVKDYIPHFKQFSVFAVKYEYCVLSKVWSHIDYI